MRLKGRWIRFVKKWDSQFESIHERLVEESRRWNSFHVLEWKFIRGIQLEHKPMIEPYFPYEALIPIRDTVFDPNASCGLEMISGAFVWSDENYHHFVAACSSHGNKLYWQPIVYRSSVILGRPREDCRAGWEALRQFVPQWPGFRPERYSEELREGLEKALAEME
jgi:hypothetical protein